MREYTIQFLDSEHNWVRITAVYDTWDSVLVAASGLLAQGCVIRVLGRDRDKSTSWKLLRSDSYDVIKLGDTVWGCPI